MSYVKLLNVILPMALVVSANAYAAQPPDVVQSDADQDVAMGSGALYNLSGGYSNTAAGDEAMYNTTTGTFNSAFGENSLLNNISGTYNAGFGYAALYLNSGSYNTAVGGAAMLDSASGNENTAIGFKTLYGNSGSNNTAIGYEALYGNSTGANNTAVGESVLYSNTSGKQNTGFGYDALYSVTTSGNNAAFGAYALYDDTTGSNNLAFGVAALEYTTTGSVNTALGPNALQNNKTGSYNIAQGNKAGLNITGSYNIDIGNQGVAGESGIIRIGESASQTEAFLAGVSTSQVTGAAVYVTSSGQLGVLASSERYKTDVQTMGTSADKLGQLRPVTFHLKTEPHGALQYGLIAEEVDKVYPDLVVRDDAGKIQGVRYDELAPMLLRKVQQLEAENAAMRQEFTNLRAAIVELQGKDQRVASR